MFLRFLNAEKKNIREKHLLSASENSIDLGENCCKILNNSAGIKEKIKKSVLSDLCFGLECVRAALINTVLNLEYNNSLLKNRRISLKIKKYKDVLKKISRGTSFRYCICS